MLLIILSMLITTAIELGGYKPIEDEKVVKEQTDMYRDQIINFLMHQEGLDDITLLDKMEITKAEMQLVNGANYRLTMNVGRHQGIVVKYFLGREENEIKDGDLELLDKGTLMPNKEIPSSAPVLSYFMSAAMFFSFFVCVGVFWKVPLRRQTEKQE